MNKKVEARTRRTVATLERLARIAEREANRIAKLKFAKLEDIHCESELRNAAGLMRTGVKLLQQPIEPELSLSP